MTKALAAAAERIATNMPIRYKAIISRGDQAPKKAAVNNVNTGNFAEQDIKGIRKIVSFLSRSLVKVLEAITAGTEQPKPTSIGTKLRPDKPNFLKGLSMMKAIRAI